MPPAHVATPAAPTSWLLRMAQKRTEWLSNPRLHAWASQSVFTRWLVRRRAHELFDVMAGFVHTQVLLACLELELLPRLQHGGQSAAALAKRHDMDTDAMTALLDSAVTLRLLRRRRDLYTPGPLATPLLAHPGIRDMVRHNALLYADMQNPVALMRQPQASGMHRFWLYTDGSNGLAHNSHDAHDWSAGSVAAYSGLMASSQGFLREQLLQVYPFDQHRHVMDVGGGQGAWVGTLAARFDRLQLTLVDLPPVAELAKQRLKDTGLSERVRCHGMHFGQESLPAGADLITLLRVAHDHPDEVVRQLMQACWQALPAGGTLLLAEPMAEQPKGAQRVDPYYHFYLLAMGQGRLRTAQRLALLMSEAGFVHIESLPTPLPMHGGVVVGRKPGDKNHANT